jgi:DNA-binding transcriptional ArsR family regulator
MVKGLGHRIRLRPEATLEEAGLVTGRRGGREVLYRVKPDGLTATASWMTTLARASDDRLGRLKREAEADTLGG